MKKQYQLVITVPFEGIDDIEAREKCAEWLRNHFSALTDIVASGGKQKLQRIFEDKQPKGIALPTNIFKSTTSN